MVVGDAASLFGGSSDTGGFDVAPESPPPPHAPVLTPVVSDEGAASLFSGTSGDSGGGDTHDVFGTTHVGASSGLKPPKVSNVVHNGGSDAASLFSAQMSDKNEDSGSAAHFGAPNSPPVPIPQHPDPMLSKDEANEDVKEYVKEVSAPCLWLCHCIHQI